MARSAPSGSVPGIVPDTPFVTTGRFLITALSPERSRPDCVRRSSRVYLAAAVGNLAGGSVGFSFNGQNYVVGQTSDLLTGMGV